MNVAKVIVRWLITAIAVAVAIWIVPGLEIVGIGGTDITVSIVVLAALLALLNTFIRPILQVISLPITIITLGIFALVVNTSMLYLASWLGGNLFSISLNIESFLSALLASIIISVVSMILNALTGVNDNRNPGSRYDRT
jgi:putative membrane protein